MKQPFRLGSAGSPVRSRSVRRGRVTIIALCTILLSGMSPAGRTTALGAGAHLPATPHLSNYGSLPVPFEVNRGQSDRSVAFVAHLPGATLLIKPDQTTLLLGASSGDHPAGGQHTALSGTVLRLRALGGATHVRITAGERLAGVVNYILGRDSTKWHTNIPTYRRVTLHSVYPGINLVYRSSAGRLEYDWLVGANADPARIQLGISGSGRPWLDAHGNLHTGTVVQRHPVAYQTGNGIRHTVSSRFILEAGGRVGIAVARYDHHIPLVIDPTLVYSTYLGGGGSDRGNAIAADAAGNAYVTGSTTSTSFPVAPSPTGACPATVGGPLQPCYGGSTDAYVTKINPAGTALVYSTYLGGSGLDAGTGIAVDGSGSAYVTGYTASPNFPTAPASVGACPTATGGAFQPCPGGNGVPDAFVSKLDPDGAVLQYSTYLGGSGIDEGNAIAIDGSGSAYVTGYTASADFPVAPSRTGACPGATGGPVQPCYGGGADDAFVSKVNPAGTALMYSTYLGGENVDIGAGITVDAVGSAYVVGSTGSGKFPVAPSPSGTCPAKSGGPFQSCYGGSTFDAFVSKLNPAGSALLYSTYLGAGGADQATGVAIDGSGNAYVSGFTTSAHFPIAPAYGGACPSPSGGPVQPCLLGGPYDAFVTKLNPTGSALVYSTYLGGSGSDQGKGIAVDASGSALVTGSTASPNFPVAPAPVGPCSSGPGGPVQPCYGAATDAFVTQLNPAASSLIYSTYLGGSGEDTGNGIALDRSANVYVAGSTTSGDFPVAPSPTGACPAASNGPLQPCYGGNGDAFVTKLSLAAPTAAAYSRLSLRSEGGRHIIRWRAAELVLGFNLYSGATRLNRRLVTSRTRWYVFQTTHSVGHLRLVPVANHT